VLSAGQALPIDNHFRVVLGLRRTTLSDIHAVQPRRAYAIPASSLRQVEKEESRWRGSPAARLSSSRVDWPAQPSLDLAQNYFSRISWIVSIVLLPPAGRDPRLSVIGALG
jgi:hypothetical protein